MKIILLSGGSGKRLWPLSNDSRSKQFLRLLRNDEGEKESMIQRVVRQINESSLSKDVVVATSVTQKDSIENQLGDKVEVVTEPCRRDTFPAIALASAWLAAQGASPDEPVVVMPCDTYTERGYFEVIAQMADAVAHDAAELVLMGIDPDNPSEKYGYIVPDKKSCKTGAWAVNRFTEKPDKGKALALLEQGALWNGGVFAFKLSYVLDIAKMEFGSADFDDLHSHYSDLNKISFDYAVVEKAKSVGVVPFHGSWKDLGTWDTLSEELPADAIGNVMTKDCEAVHAINELEIPLVCVGLKDAVVAASPDGILVAATEKTEGLKQTVSSIGSRPMYEERRWGEYRVINTVEFEDGFKALTKQLLLEPGKSISYQRHNYRDEVWTFLDGEGEIVIDGQRKPVRRGDVINISKGQLHTLKAYTRLTFIEVQSGDKLVEEDIERFRFEW